MDVVVMTSHLLVGLQPFTASDGKVDKAKELAMSTNLGLQNHRKIRDLQWLFALGS